MRKSLSKGQALVELLLAIALAAIVLPALITGLVSAREGGAQQKLRLEAISLVQDAQEKTRIVRERGWNYFTCLNPCYPVASGNTWSLFHSTDPDPIKQLESVGVYKRKIEFFPVYRDINNDDIITPNTGIYTDPATYYTDPATYKVTVTVTWDTPLKGIVSETNYMTRFLDNITLTHTTVADFSTGSDTGIAPNNVQVSSDFDDGHFTSSPAGHGAWCNPDPNLIAPIGLPLNGVSSKVRTYADPAGITNRAFIATGNGSNNSVAYVDVNIANPPYPTAPPASVRGVWRASISGSGATTYGLSGDDTYTYLAVDNNNQQFVVLNTSVLTPTPGPTGLPSFGKIYGVKLDENNPIAPASGAGIYVDTTTHRAYVLQFRFMYIFDVTTPSVPVLLGTYTSRTGNAQFNNVYVQGQYAYLTNITGTKEELTILDISNPASPKFAAWADLSSGTGGVDLYMNPDGSRLYVASSQSNDIDCYITPAAGHNGCEFFAMNVTDKSHWTTPVWYPGPSPTPHPTNGAPGKTDTYPSVPVAAQYDFGRKFDARTFAVVYDQITPTPPDSPKPSQVHALVGGYHIAGPSPVANPSPTPDLEYKILDITDESNYFICGQASVPAGINGLGAVHENDGDSFAYLVTNDAAPTPQFKIIQGGPGVYGTLATFTSAPMSSTQVGTSDAVWNRFKVGLNRLAGVTDIQLQVAVANAADCSTATYSFIGPDKTSATYFVPSSDTTMEGQIPIGSFASGNYNNPGHCFKYQVTLTTNNVSYRPQFNDFTAYLTP